MEHILIFSNKKKKGYILKKDTQVEVQNIITEPTKRAERFIVYGSTKVLSNDVLVDQG